MPVPDFQQLMLPALKLASDRQEHSLREAIETLAVQFGLTDEERRELLPAGRQARFDNRVGWAATYLKKAGLLASAGRGRFRLTERGDEILHRCPPRIDIAYLEQYQEFISFRDASASNGDDHQQEDKAPQTPEELIEAGFQRLQANLAGELAEALAGCSPTFFEQLVVDLLIAMGYGGSRYSTRTGMRFGWRVEAIQKSP